MQKKQFSQTAKEGLQNYVYCLVNPSDGKVFYIGKGSDDRVYQHAVGAIEGDAHTEKLDLIIIRKTKRATLSERNVPKLKRNDSQAQNEAYL